MKTFAGNLVRYLWEKLHRHPSVGPEALLCPACQDDMWQDGPSGGDGYNIRCTNQHVYTYLPGHGIIDPDRYAAEPELATL